MKKRILLILATMLCFVFAYAGNGNIVLNGNENNVEVLGKSINSIHLRLTLHDINTFQVKTDHGVFTQLQIDNYVRNTEEGSPLLPMFKRLVELPSDAEISINIVGYTEEIIDLNNLGITNKLFPVQPSLNKSIDPADAPFIYNTADYAIDDFNKRPIAEVQHLGKMRGTEIGRLTVAPLRYNPVQNILKVYNNIEIEITFNGDVQKTNMEKERFYSPAFEPMLSRLLNYTPGFTKDPITQYPVKFVIISDRMFESSLTNFINWKTKKGFNVVTAYTDDIGTTTSAIKDYLQGLYNAGTAGDPAPTYVLFVGDVAQIPAFSGTSGQHITDLYYCTYDGTGDIFPEMYYGRFSANNVGQLGPQIDKTLQYEKYLLPSTDFLNEVILVSGVDASFAPTQGNGQINYGTDNYFNLTHGITSHTYLYGSGSPITSNQAGAIDDILAKFNSGVSFVNYTAHCWELGWADPSFEVAEVATLTNSDKYPLSIGNCCLSNKFDENECFGEALLRADKKGALGHIGGSNSTYWDEDFWWGVGSMASGSISANPTYAGSGLGAYDCLFHENGEAEADWYISNGQIIQSGNLAVSEAGGSETYYWEIYHLMGDPSLMTYITVPDPLTVNYINPATVGTTQLTVNTEQYAYVAISMDNVLLDAKYSGTGTSVTLEFPALVNPGAADIVVTKQFRQPYIGTLDIVTGNSNNDAQLASIIVPLANHSVMAADVIPKVVIRNLGLSDLTSVEVGYQIDGGSISSVSWSGLLAQYATDTVLFPQITLPTGTHTFTAFTSWPNGVEDEFHAGDTLSKTFNVTAGDASLKEILGLEAVYCDVPDFIPTFTLINKGTVNLQSADVCYKIDNGTPVIVNWTGSLAPNAETTITFPSVQLPAGNHTLFAYTNNPNGGADENTGNDSKSSDFLVYENAQVIAVSITPDDYGSETTWDITDNSTGNILYSGGPFQNWNTTNVTESFCMGDGCYTFTIHDSYGDGQAGWQNDGTYEVSNTTSSEIYGSGGGNFGTSATVQFCITITGTDKIEEAIVSVFPNPTKDFITVYNANNGDEIKIMDILGNVVGIYTASGNVSTINLSQYSDGIYYISVGNTIFKTLLTK